tara:strand:- start:243 stop:461 length:219 start_codon:yes stop_codon:yes gene_type:complete
MKKIFIVFLLIGCSSDQIIVADLRMSKEKAQLFQRDLQECKELSQQAKSIFKPNVTIMTENCLEGRGHSIIK